MLAIIGIVVVVIGLLVSIAWHELGHLLPAKLFGVKVTEYFVGFGPTVWSRRRGDTTYGIKAIPLGGYVRLVGMVPPEHAVKPVRIGGWAGRLIADARAAAQEEIGDDDARAFYHLSWWRKVVVMAGGPVMNLILAVVLFTVVLSGVGVPTQSLTMRDTVACIPATADAACTPNDPGSPARAAGIVPGDRMVAADGIPLDSWADFTDYVAARASVPIELVVAGQDGQRTVTITPAPRTVTDANGAATTVGFLGVYSQVVNEHQPWWSGTKATGTYLGQTVDVVAQLPTQLYHVTRAALGLEERSQTSVMGIVGIGRTAGEVTATDNDAITVGDQIAQLLLLIAGLNLALFVFNVIPLVPLDGGHVASALWQAVKNGWARIRGAARPAPVDVARMMPVAYGVFGILIVMSLVLIYADIVAPVRLT